MPYQHLLLPVPFKRVPTSCGPSYSNQRIELDLFRPFAAGATADRGWPAASGLSESGRAMPLILVASIMPSRPMPLAAGAAFVGSEGFTGAFAGAFEGALAGSFAGLTRTAGATLWPFTAAAARSAAVRIGLATGAGAAAARLLLRLPLACEATGVVTCTSISFELPLDFFG